MCQQVGQDVLKFSCTGVNTCVQLVDHMHGGHVVSEHPDEHIAKTCSSNSSTNSTQLQVVVVHQLYIKWPRALHKGETMQVTIPSPPTTCTSISTNNNSALGGEPIAGGGVLTQLQPILLQVLQGAVRHPDGTCPPVNLCKCFIQCSQIEAPKGQCKTTTLQIPHNTCQLLLADPPSLGGEMVHKVPAQSGNTCQLALG